MGRGITVETNSHRLAAVWKMPYDQYWILMRHDFSTEKTRITHYGSEQDASKHAEEFLSEPLSQSGSNETTYKLEDLLSAGISAISVVDLTGKVSSVHSRGLRFIVNDPSREAEAMIKLYKLTNHKEAEDK